MINLPATLEAAERNLMVDFARQQLVKWLDGDPASENSMTAIVRQYWKQTFKLHAMQRTDAALDVIEIARSGDVLADEALRELWRELCDCDQPIPTSLKSFMMEVSRRGDGWRFRRRQGKKKHQYVLRNLGIVFAIAALYYRFGLLPSKRSDHTISGSEIVGEALGIAGFRRLSHDAVEKVWDTYGGAAPTVPDFWKAAAA